MKKIISAFTATMMAAASLVSVSALAVNFPVPNEYTLSTSTVESDIVIDDTTIPAGSLAVTVNISNNTGFSASSTKIALDDACNAIVDENGMLVVESGSILNDAHISGAVGEDFVFVATASAENSTANGDMFTFFVADNGDNNETLSIISNNSEDIASISSVVSPMSSSEGFYKIGDVDNDDTIDSSDASYTLSAIEKTGRSKLSYKNAEVLPKYYFPKIYDINSAFIWEGNPPIDKEHTADVMLDYYVRVSAGKDYVYVSDDPDETFYTNENLNIGYVRPSSNPTY